MTWNWTWVGNENKDSGFVNTSGGHLVSLRMSRGRVLDHQAVNSAFNSLSKNVFHQISLWNDYILPIFNSLPAGKQDQRWPSSAMSEKINPLSYGLQGASLFVLNDAAENISDGRYWHELGRPKTIAEVLEDLWDNINQVNTTISSSSSGSGSSAVSLQEAYDEGRVVSTSLGPIIFNGQGTGAAGTLKINGGTGGGDNLSVYDSSGNKILYANDTGAVGLEATNGLSISSSTGNITLSSTGTNVVILDGYDVHLIPDRNALISPDSELRLKDGNQTGWTQTYLTLSDDSSEWSDYKSNLGEVSLLKAIVDIYDVASNITLTLQECYEGGSSLALDDANGSISIDGSALTSGNIFTINDSANLFNIAHDGIIHLAGSSSLYLGRNSSDTNQGDLYLTDGSYSGVNGPANAIPLTDESNTDFDFATSSMMHAFNQLYGLANNVPEPLVIPTTDQEFIDALESTSPCTIILRAQDYTISSAIYTGATKVIIGTGYSGQSDDGTKSSRIVCDGGYLRVDSDNFIIQNVRLAYVSGDHCIYVRPSGTTDEDERVIVESCHFEQTNSMSSFYVYAFSGKNITVKDCVFRLTEANTGVFYNNTHSGRSVFSNNIVYINGTSLSNIISISNAEGTHIFNNQFIVDTGTTFLSGSRIISPHSDRVTIENNYFDCSFVDDIESIIESTANPIYNCSISNNTFRVKGSLSASSGGVIKGRFSNSIISANNIITSLGRDYSGEASNIGVINLRSADHVSVIGNRISGYSGGYKCGVAVDYRCRNVIIKDNQFLEMGAESKSVTHYGVFVYRSSDYSSDYPIAGLAIKDNVFTLSPGKESTVKGISSSSDLPSPWEEIFVQNNLWPRQNFQRIDWDSFGPRLVSDTKRTTSVSSDYEIKNYDKRIDVDASSGEIDLHLYHDFPYMDFHDHIVLKKTDSSANAVNILSKGFKTVSQADAEGKIIQNGSLSWEFQRYHQRIVFNDEFYWAVSGGEILKWDEATQSIVVFYSGPSSIRSLAKYTNPSSGTDEVLYFCTNSPDALMSWNGASFTDHGNNGGLDFVNLTVDSSVNLVYLNAGSDVYSFDPNTSTWTALGWTPVGAGDIGAMHVWDGSLFANDSYEIYEWDGSTWTTHDIETDTSDGSKPTGSTQLLSDNSYLYAIDEDEIFSYDGTNWELVCDSSDTKFEFINDDFSYVIDGDDFYGLGKGQTSSEDYSANSVSLYHLNKNHKNIYVTNQFYTPTAYGLDDNEHCVIAKYDSDKFFVVVYDQLFILERMTIDDNYSVTLSSQGDAVGLRYDGQDWWS